MINKEKEKFIVEFRKNSVILVNMWLTLLLIFLCLVYYALKKKFLYWKERGVPGPEPNLIFGNWGPSLFGKKTVADLYTDIYK